MVSVQLTDRALKILFNKRGVGADRLQRARDDPFRLLPPRRSEGVLLCIPLRMIVVPITHDLIHLAAVHTACLSLNLLDEVAEERGAWRKRRMVDVAVQGLVHCEHELIPTRVKADSFRGFQTGASQIPWWRTGGSPCGQGLRFARTMTRPSFGHWRKRAGMRVKVGGCWRWPRSMMAAPGPKRLGSAASGCRRFGTGWCGSTPAGLRA